MPSVRAAKRAADRGLPIATRQGPFALGRHNSFWKLENLGFIAQMDPRLAAYLAFAFAGSRRMDFLRAVEERPSPELLSKFLARPHNVWETAVWIELAGRRLVRRADGSHLIVAAGQLRPGDTALPNQLRPCRIQARDTGEFTFEPAAGPTNAWIYDRGDPVETNGRARPCPTCIDRSVPDGERRCTAGILGWQ